MKQQVLSYESKIILHNSGETIHGRKFFNPHRYSAWTLQDTIDKYVGKLQYSIKWMGNDQNSHILSFFYCLLLGCLREQSSSDEFFIKMKFNLYQESKLLLNISEQKLLIQHLGLIEDSKHIEQFLKKSVHLQPIFVKLYDKKISVNLQQQQNTFPVSNKMEALNVFASIFPFVNYKTHSQKCASLSMNNFLFFILQQKQCFFVVEESNQKYFSCNISCVESKKKQKTEQNLDCIQNSNEFKTTKGSHPTTTKAQKNMLEPYQQKIKTQQIFLQDQVGIQNKVYKNKIKTKVQRYSLCPSIDNLSTQDKPQAVQIPIGKKPTTNIVNKMQLKSINEVVSQRQQNKVQNKTLRYTLNSQKFHYLTSKNIASPSMLTSKERSLAKQNEIVEQQTSHKNKNTTMTTKKIESNQEISQMDKFEIKAGPKIKCESSEGLKSNRTAIKQQENKNDDIHKLHKHMPPFLNKKLQDTSQITFNGSPCKPHYSPKGSVNKKIVQAWKESNRKISQIKSQKHFSNHFPVSQIQQKTELYSPKH